MKLLRLEESVSAEFLTDGIDLKEAIEEARNGNPKKFVVKIQAIHAKTTKNNIEYTSERLRGYPELTVDGVIRPTGQYSWTRPYSKPILTHHDPHSDPLGRIVDAKFVEKTLPSGLPGIEVSAEIGNPEAIEKIRDGRFLTVSIGAKQILYSAIFVGLTNYLTTPTVGTGRDRYTMVLNVAILLETFGFQS